VLIHVHALVRMQTTKDAPMNITYQSQSTDFQVAVL
jgi:hypothetical protein